jgi:hypothetical protein
MLETHVNSPVTVRRLRSGPAADHIDAFADWLQFHGYTPTSIGTLLISLAGWTRGAIIRTNNTLRTLHSFFGYGRCSTKYL